MSQTTPRTRTRCRAALAVAAAALTLTGCAEPPPVTAVVADCPADWADSPHPCYAPADDTSTAYYVHPRVESLKNRELSYPGEPVRLGGKFYTVPVSR